MKKYDVCVKETLQRDVFVEAINQEDAIRKVKEQYDNEKIVLDYEDYAGVDYFINNSEENAAAEEKYLIHKAAQKMVLENMAEMPLWIFTKLYRDGDIDDIELLNFSVMDRKEIKDIDYYPSYKTVFRVTSEQLKLKIKANMCAINELGLLIYHDYLNDKIYIGINGEDCNLYETYWEPLYNILGFTWHLTGAV